VLNGFREEHNFDVTGGGEVNVPHQGRHHRGKRELGKS